MNKQSTIETKIKKNLHPEYLKVENISHKHRVPEDAETHFQITIVSTEFSSHSLIKRHRILNELLNEELNQGVHALTMNLYTPEEWTKFGPHFNPPPNCAHK